MVIRQAEYKIRKDQVVQVSSGMAATAQVTLRDVQAHLGEISLYDFVSQSSEQNKRTYVLPGAKTSVTPYEEGKEIILQIRTSRRKKVEKGLRKLLDNFYADWYMGSREMRSQDYVRDD